MTDFNCCILGLSEAVKHVSCEFGDMPEDFIILILREKLGICDDGSELRGYLQGFEHGSGRAPGWLKTYYNAKIKGDSHQDLSSCLKGLSKIYSGNETE